MTTSQPRPSTAHWTPNPDPTSIIVPGVDATASVNDQIDQIDQLITIRLQNIDANFSRVQNIISAKLLPAFKRYAESTEPVREAAKFWKSFYEAAAQVRIPIANDTSSLYRVEDGDSEHDHTTVEPCNNPDRTPVDVSPQEDSFVRGAPVSSTPRVRDPMDVTLTRDTEDDDSWAASIESPFERLGRQVKDLTLEEVKQNSEDPLTISAPSFSPMHGTYSSAPTRAMASRTPGASGAAGPTPRSPRKGQSPLRQTVLRQNATMVAASDASSTPLRPLRTPHRVTTPRNPFLPHNSMPRQWSGLVDLRQPSPARVKASRAQRTPGRSMSNKEVDYDSDSSDDLFPPGMSPPVTMQFAMPSRIQKSPVKLALTPARRAAERITRDLVANATNRSMGTGTTTRILSSMSQSEDPSLSSIAPSLPSLTRYSGHPAPIHPSAINTILELPQIPREADLLTPVHQVYRLRSGAEMNPQESDPPHRLEIRPYTEPESRRLIVDEETAPSPASDTDSDSSEHNESNPSAAFIFATQNNARAHADDSFGSSQQSMSSDEDEDDAARAARHPLAHIFAGSSNQGGGGENSFQDDSFVVEEEEETVFGARQVGQTAAADARLRIMRDSLLDDTYPGAPSLNPFAQIEQSPTPFAGDAQVLR